uniref:Uncharacterized protein n=1 Tax=Arundo donax TaxID=35708 RepID=A0A0A8ZLZ5_ARUDO
MMEMLLQVCAGWTDGRQLQAHEYSSVKLEARGGRHMELMKVFSLLWSGCSG